MAPEPNRILNSIPLATRMSEPLRIEIENAAVEISPEGLEEMLAGRGTDLRFSRLEFRLTAAAVQALVARLLPSEGEPARAEVSPQGLLLEGTRHGRGLRIRLDATALRVVPGEGEVRLVTEGGEDG
jgi:hypothetical protein